MFRTSKSLTDKLADDVGLLLSAQKDGCRLGLMSQGFAADADPIAKPCEGGAQAAVSHSREAIDLRQFGFMRTIARRQEHDRAFMGAFDSHNLGIEEAFSYGVIAGVELEGFLREHQPWAVLENEVAAVLGHQFSISACGDFIGFATEEHPVGGWFGREARGAARNDLPNKNRAETRQAKRPTGDEPCSEDDRERHQRAEP